jgi:phage baseplate assembly protein W
MGSYNSINDPFRGEVLYRDFDLSMLSNPSTGDLRTKTNLDSIKQSMLTLLFINSGELSFLPQIGSGMQETLFEQVDPISVLMLQREISATLAAFEPRINILAVNVGQDSVNLNGLNIDVYFSIINSPNVETLSFLLSRFR